MEAPIKEQVEKVAKYPIRNHPNASLTATTGAIATLVIWISSQAGLTMTGEHGAAVATLLATAALVVGRKGLKGIFRSIWGGDERK